MLLCKLTDLELSGAPQLATREAGRGRPTRPLERLVRRQVASAEEWLHHGIDTSFPLALLTRKSESYSFSCSSSFTRT